jgi:hypothetical protein
MAYQVEGRILEVCTCKVLCPCWVGEDPDGGTCDGLLAWHIEKGSIEGVEVAGRTIAVLGHIPGNILQGNWTIRLYVDDKASAQQKDALLEVWTGKKGGAIADLAKLIGEVVSIEQVPIAFPAEGVKGTVRIGAGIEAGLQPFTDSEGRPTKLSDSIFSTIPGSPAYVGKASHYKVNVPGFQIDLQNHNAISGQFRFAA